MTATGISQGEAASWQRRAAAELGRILAARPCLPCINWTAGPAGLVVVGQVSGLAPAGKVRLVFQAWRLALEEYREQHMSSATAWLHAAARQREVRVRLTATVFPSDGREN